MKKLLLTALALMGVGALATEASAQFSVYGTDGKVLFSTQEMPDYVDFTYTPPCGGKVGEAVDMGLSVKWASWNVGASTPEEYGGYYAWGETETKDSYEISTYTTVEKFIGDNKVVLDKEDDAASVNWGGNWAMPTIADWQELKNNCEITWTDDYKGDGSNKKGYIVKSKKDGNTNFIFLPAAGYRNGSSLKVDENFSYWSSSLSEDYTVYSLFVYSLSASSSTISKHYRFYGQSVRPVCPAPGITNNHTAVDLGLPSGKLWATCNVGANNPEESGDYFAWGETESKSDYSRNTYKHLQSGKSSQIYINKYQINDGLYGCVWYESKYKTKGGKTVLESADDVATQSWGEDWRMPTNDECNELKNNTTWEWTDDYNGTGVAGCILTSTIEGYTNASIFLPAAGGRVGSNLKYKGSSGHYWSSLLYLDDFGYSYDMFINSEKFGTGYNTERYMGLPVRPVCSK